MPRNDVVVDNDVMRLYGTPAAAGHRRLFEWLHCCGALCLSLHVIHEYNRQGSPFVAALIDRLTRAKRVSVIKNSWINGFETEDSRYQYTCNGEDIPVARTCFRSHRKLLVSADARLRSDVNRFRMLGGVKPEAYDSLPVERQVSAGVVCGMGAHPQI